MLGERDSSTPPPYPHGTGSRARVLSLVTVQVPDCLTPSRLPCACASPRVSPLGLACLGFLIFGGLGSWVHPTCATAAQHSLSQRAAPGPGIPPSRVPWPALSTFYTSPNLLPEQLGFIKVHLSAHSDLLEAALLLLPVIGHLSFLF